MAEGNFYIKLVVSGGTPAFDADETELEVREYFYVRDITKPDAPTDVRINYPPRVPIELKVTGL